MVFQYKIVRNSFHAINFKIIPSQTETFFPNLKVWVQVEKFMEKEMNISLRWSLALCK